MGKRCRSNCPPIKPIFAAKNMAQVYGSMGGNIITREGWARMENDNGFEVFKRW